MCPGLGEVDDIMDCGLKLLPLEMQQLPLMSYNMYYKHSKYAVVMLYPNNDNRPWLPQSIAFELCNRQEHHVQ